MGSRPLPPPARDTTALDLTGGVGARHGCSGNPPCHRMADARPCGLLSFRSRALGARAAAAMSKFFKALEQAKRDRALASGAIGAAVRAADSRLAAGSAADTAPAPRPMTESADDVDEHLVSLVTPAAFEAEQ